MERCPHCGGTSGYYTKEVVRYLYYSHFDGSEDERRNELANQERVFRNKTIAYCTDCNKRIATLEEMTG